MYAGFSASSVVPLCIADMLVRNGRRSPHSSGSAGKRSTPPFRFGGGARSTLCVPSVTGRPCCAAVSIVPLLPCERSALGDLLAGRALRFCRSEVMVPRPAELPRPFAQGRPASPLRHCVVASSGVPLGGLLSHSRRLPYIEARSKIRLHRVILCDATEFYAVPIFSFRDLLTLVELSRLTLTSKWLLIAFSN